MQQVDKVVLVVSQIVIDEEARKILFRELGRWTCSCVACD